MKKQDLKSLKLNKKTVSNLQASEVSGGTLTGPITQSIIRDCFSLVRDCFGGGGSQILCA